MSVKVQLCKLVTCGSYLSKMVRQSFCCRKGDPLPGPKLGSCLTVGNELSKETRVLTKQEISLGKGTRWRAVG